MRPTPCIARLGPQFAAPCAALLAALLAAPFAALLVALLAALLTLQACSTAPALKRFDFYTPAPGDEVAWFPLASGIEVTAPPWLDSPAILYRLDYTDASQVHAYAQSQWVGPPARLLEQLLRQGGHAAAPVCTGTPLGAVPAAGGVPDTHLEVELQDFSQDFSAPQASAVVLRARVRLRDARSRALLAQRNFELRAATSPADATGAIHGLRDLARTFADAVLAWTGQVACGPGTGAAAPNLRIP